MSVTVSSTNYSGYSANVILYHPTGTTIPYYSATTTNIGTKTLPFTYDVSDEILEYGTFECSMNAFTPSKICTAVVLAGPDGDGNYYKTIKIGNQIWTSENLKTFSFLDGTPISVFDLSYCNNDQSTLTDYGLLYKQIVVTGTTSSTSLCPSGWHVPTQSEVTTLQTAMGGESVGGGNGKIPGFDYWDSPNTGANNSEGFSAVGTGYRTNFGSWEGFKQYARWWSFTPNYAWVFYHNYSNFTITTYGNTWRFSVRCLKDY